MAATSSSVEGFLPPFLAIAFSTAAGSVWWKHSLVPRPTSFTGLSAKRFLTSLRRSALIDGSTPWA